MFQVLVLHLPNVSCQSEVAVYKSACASGLRSDVAVKGRIKITVITEYNMLRTGCVKYVKKSPRKYDECFG